MFVLRFTVRLPLEENLFKKETRELKFLSPAELLKTYKKLKQYENIFFYNIRVYLVFEEEIDLENFNWNMLKEGQKRWSMNS
jgi:hypothetical protein